MDKVKYDINDDAKKFESPHQGGKTIYLWKRSRWYKRVLVPGKDVPQVGIDAKGTVSIDKFICDIFIEEYNLIIEFYGDYWHCNPKRYKSDFLHPHKKKKLFFNH